MEINTNYIPNSNTPTTQANRETGEKNSTPNNNQIIKGEVSQLPNGDIQIKSPDGSTVSGTPTKPTEPGGEQSFLVKVVDGKIFLEPVKTESPQTEAIRNALEAAGLKADSESINLAKILLSYNLPLNKENLQNFRMGLKLTGDAEKAVFLLENNIRPTLKNTELLTRILSGENMVAEGLSELAKSLENLVDPQIKTILKNILTPGQSSDFTQSKLSLPVESSQNNPAENLPGNNATDSPLKTQDSIRNHQTSAATIIDEAVKNILQNIPAKADSSVVKLLQEVFPEESRLIVEQLEENSQMKEVFARLADENNSIRKQNSVAPKDAKNSEQTLNQIHQNKLSLPNNLLQKALNSNLSADELKAIQELLKLQANAETVPKDTTQNSVRAKLSYNPKEENNIGKYLTDLSMRLELAKKIIEKLPQAGAEDVLKNINNLRQNIQFTTQVKQCEYFQVPINIDNRDSNGEFYIVKNKKKSHKEGGIVSALIALDTANMGRFETYLVKDGREVECRFRLENDDVTELVKSNITQLEELLRQYNYSLKFCSYQPLSKPFNLLDTGKKEKNAELGRFAVDIRA